MFNNIVFVSCLRACQGLLKYRLFLFLLDGSQLRMRSLIYIFLSFFLNSPFPKWPWSSASQSALWSIVSKLRGITSSVVIMTITLKCLSILLSTCNPLNPLRESRALWRAPAFVWSEWRSGYSTRFNTSTREEKNQFKECKCLYQQEWHRYNDLIASTT